MDKYEQELFPTENSKVLRGSFENDYMRRLSKIDNIAEVYHENSKIYYEIKNKIINGLDEMHRVNMWAKSKFNDPLQEDLMQEQQIIKNINDLKSENSSIGQLSNLFKNSKFKEVDDGINFMVYVNGRVYILNRNSDLFIKQINSISADDIGSIFLTKQSDAVNNIYIFVIGKPWRYMRFIGASGYRQCLLDAGEAIKILQDNLNNVNITKIFYDDAVHSILNLDGIENICLGIASYH
ncbi:hypothetical protein FFV08_10790 [Streptococcus sanguinis]|uniref:Nitroreductase family protein n=1 Tax=Streptococcus sanguinis TaxID=1305 RepID=A0A7H8V9Y7_STRSA|nr:hypothetical protein FFV08_10790 [Streptococcus sanguinis]